MNESGVERFGKHVLAIIVLLIAAWIVIKQEVANEAAQCVPLLVIGASSAIVWAWRVLF